MQDTTPTTPLAKYIVRCQYWEWYGDDDFHVFSREFIVELDPSHDEQEMLAAWNAEHNREGKWTRYEAHEIAPYREPGKATFADGKFTLGRSIGEL